MTGEMTPPVLRQDARELSLNGNGDMKTVEHAAAAAAAGSTMQTRGVGLLEKKWVGMCCPGFQK